MKFSSKFVAATVASLVYVASPVSAAIHKVMECGDKSYTYNSMVGWGMVPGAAVDKYGDTISFGSSMSIERPSIKRTLSASGSYIYTATVYNLPDRGWNTNGTTNFAPRIYAYNITFEPLPNGSVAPNLNWTLVDTILLTDPFGNTLTGFDSDTTLSFEGFPVLPAATFESNGWSDTAGGQNSSVRVCLDAETLNVIDGSIKNGFWITDEYGPYLYKFNRYGMLVSAIRPPEAFIPYRNGEVSFSADSPRLNSGEDDDVDPADPDSGRANNQGFEGASLSPSGNYIFSLLQSATIQDGGSKKTTNRYTRLLKHAVGSHTLAGEWVVPLPQYTDPDQKKNPRTAAQSEIYALSEEQFLIIARDSNHGHGQSDSTSIYRNIDVFDITNATDISGISEYNVEGGAVAPSGVLDDAITPATYCTFLNVNLNSQLKKFGPHAGLHNGGNQDSTLLNEKWEGLTMIPADGKDGSDGIFYAIVVTDDDFMTQWGHVNYGRITYKDTSGYDLINMGLVYQITLPTSLKPFGIYQAGN
ncbi:esterase-like activity of phytase-domain-containing protein [Lipomyces oligophaga]|uniref:esterase-like activity of phytase-domain-containing protein n=1 Tax=Lipomyces oligophaga TaxID=45792 RepID=UPI0034CF8805